MTMKLTLYDDFIEWCFFNYCIVKSGNLLKVPVVEETQTNIYMHCRCLNSQSTYNMPGKEKSRRFSSASFEVKCLEKAGNSC